MVHTLVVTWLYLLQVCASHGPVLSNNFPDPSIIRVGDKYYGFATRTRVPRINVQVAEATAADSTRWSLREGYDAMPSVPEWVNTETMPGPEVWSPDVNQLDDGTFVLYFAAASRRLVPSHEQRQHCIGAALSNNVLGPYQPLEEPLACDLEAGGAIDPDGFLDLVSGKRYLLYKVDGNSLGRNGSCSRYIAPTPLMLQQVKVDGVSLVDQPIELLTNTRYDGPNIEAPSLVYHDQKHYLLYNSRCWANQTYNVKYAVSYDGVEGPYHKSPRPLLVSGQKLNGVELHAPGGVEVDPSNSSRIVFHSDTNVNWFALKTFDPKGRIRAMFAADLRFDDGGLLTVKSIGS